ncbi:MAG TPA: alpha-L-fucosidase [Puia sp.]|nr:alpha-L-fucosidase [Puia sp.]
MSISRRNLIKSGLVGGAAIGLHPIELAGLTRQRSRLAAGEPASVLPAIAEGPFQPTRASLRTYEIPAWFRDAKFGIWAHWGPQSAVGDGDWYARNMYLEGGAQYEYHLKTYGHPSKFGFKDTIPAWKAEKFDPDHLMGLYKKAGAKYFMTMGVHHDNFDLWNSRHNPWNAVNMGPKKDIVGMWKQAAQRHGLRFAISDHLWISYKWFSSSKGSDAKGAMAGIPYDGADPKNFDYYGRCEEVLDGDLEWNEDGIPETWKRHWYDRIRDLVDQYEPDLLYCDGHLPFEEYGQNLLAHLYNQNAAKNGGKTQAVYTSKRAADSAKGKAICVFDVERGVVSDIWPLPWQTDTCIGDWHYSREMVGHYKTPKTVVDMLVDIVSKNGNLMLNIPLPASGMPDADELAVLEGITGWMTVNGEAIYATRPWRQFGEGPSAEKKSDRGSSFNEAKRQDMTAGDIRFTTKGDTLYAFFMGWPAPGEAVNIRALSGAGIAKVELLGGGQLSFRQDGNGLSVQLPGHKPCEYACALRITGKGLI